MAKVSWNPAATSNRQSESPVVWGCHVFMREDGSFETEFKGETGSQMMKAAIDTLHTINRLRAEPACNFGNEPGG